MRGDGGWGERKAREAGLGVTARPPDGSETWEGWENSAVAPDKLGSYLHDLERLFDRYGYQQASLYGHLGQGCVHTRMPFQLRDGKGVEAFRAFLFDAAGLVASYGGSLSGEHGERAGVFVTLDHPGVHLLDQVVPAGEVAVPQARSRWCPSSRPAVSCEGRTSTAQVRTGPCPLPFLPSSVMPSSVTSSGAWTV